MVRKLFLSALGCLLISACDYQTSSDEIQRKGQEQLSKQAVQAVGMPAIINFQEKRTLKEILELRDTAISTVTYTQDMNGKLHKLCDSVGFGIPYGTQYTNPSRLADYQGMGDSHSSVLPQADPNGLFSPSGAEGTWILCLNPQTQKSSPLYVEPRVIVSPFPIATE